MRKYVLLLIVLLLLTVQAAGQSERWYVVKLLGERAGWARMSEHVRDGTIVTESEMELGLARGPASIQIRMLTSFTETSDGVPVAFTSEQSLGGSTTITSGHFADHGSLTLSTQTGEGQPTSREITLQDTSWSTPAHARRQLAAAIKESAQPHNVKTLEPTSGTTPITLTYSGFESTTTESWGATLPAFKTSVISSLVPGSPSIEYLAADGHLIRSATKLGGIEIEMILADQELARAEVDPPEIMRATFIKPDRVIKQPRRLRVARFRLSLSDQPIADLPEAASQRSTRETESSIVVSVELGRSSPALTEELKSALVASPMLDAEDALIKEFVERARPNAGADQSTRAEAIRRFVYQHVGNKSLGVGFASASDVARSRSGDCTEHAVLLAAMLRADGIPARVVSGLVYADSFVGSEDIFGYHMWTQAAITDDGGPRWIDLDGTLSRSIPFDATHIALSTSNLGPDDSQNAMLSLAPLLGVLQIEVLNTEPQTP